MIGGKPRVRDGDVTERGVTDEQESVCGALVPVSREEERGGTAEIGRAHV